MYQIKSYMHSAIIWVYAFMIWKDIGLLPYDIDIMIKHCRKIEELISNLSKKC